MTIAWLAVLFTSLVPSVTEAQDDVVRTSGRDRPAAELATTPQASADRGQAELRAYLAQVQELADNAHGQASTETQAAYVFTCGSQRYRLALTWSHPGGSLLNDHVRLEDVEQPGSDVSLQDRRRMQAALDDFRVVHTVSLRCANSGVHAFLVSGYGRLPENLDGPQPEIVRLFQFEGGRLERIAE